MGRCGRGEGGRKESQEERVECICQYAKTELVSFSSCSDMLSRWTGAGRWGGGCIHQEKDNIERVVYQIFKIESYYKNIPVYFCTSLHCSIISPFSSPKLTPLLMLTYHPAEMIWLHARRGLCVPASAHRLQNHSYTPPKQSGTSGAWPSPSVSCQEGTWDHKGCWDCRRAPTIYWHFRENKAGERRGGAVCVCVCVSVKHC